MRILGAVMILLSGGIAGLWAVKRLKARVQLLLGLQQGLLALEKEISYSVTAMGEALEKSAAAAGSAGSFFRRAGKLLSGAHGLSAEEAWSRALEEEALDAELRGLLSLPAAGLGLSDKETQVRQLELCRERLLAAEKEAKAGEERYGRLYQAMGWGGAAVLVLFLL
ncbi:MAG: stage III sporulation protein AB [Bacillota bacterium]|nr:stage III sporulation protein AB [Bacillota bacterium]